MSDISSEQVGNLDIKRQEFDAPDNEMSDIEASGKFEIKSVDTWKSFLIQT